MKQLKLLAIGLIAALAFTACSDDDGPFFTIDPVGQMSGAYVINQGNYYGGVDGTLDHLTLTGDSAYTQRVFVAVNNGQSLGSSPQGAVTYGSRIYVPMYAENLVWVIDKTTARIVTSIQTNEPEAVCAADGYVFVSNNDGYVSRIDTLTLAIDTHEAVGPNPAQMCTTGGKVYVSISDGYNSGGGYVDGCRVAEIDAQTGTKVRDIAVGVNPGPIAADADGRLFVVCRGNYADIASAVWTIPAGATAGSELAPASLIAVNGTTLYAINSVTDWSINQTLVDFKTYDTTTGTLTADNFLAGQPTPPAPQAININPQNGDIYICSDRSSAEYDKPGLLYVYKADGTHLKTYDTGIHPVGVVWY